ncbi:MAG: phosphonopyruvate decarboxylase [Desulfobacterales bacterium]|nr:phosphonopyruvate decarboxylase [Desulfobacterales bacterium]
MIQAQDFISACTSRGYTFYAGVPCSFLKPLINYVIQNPDVDYVTATSEGEAVGIAAGAYLAGRKAVVMCQNSGLGNMINPLTSLCFPFRIPILLIVTLRGEPGLNDEPQHELMGQITGELLETLHIQWDFFPDAPEKIGIVLDRAESEMAKTSLPFALIMKKGSVDKTDLLYNYTKSKQSEAVPEGEFQSKPENRMSRFESIKIICEAFGNDDAIIATTGKIGRELFTLGDTKNQLYVVGSMGCAAGIGFGIQHIKPNQRVVILDGDGAVLMKMGTFATIGHYSPEQFVHIILDNEAYESTGGQHSVSPSVDFCHIAHACGYRQCYRADTKSDLISALNSSTEFIGPSLIHVKVSSGSASDLGRPTLKPYQVKKRFMKFLERGGKIV